MVTLQVRQSIQKRWILQILCLTSRTTVTSALIPDEDAWMARATCVFSHTFKTEHQDLRRKDASCSVYPYVQPVTSWSFLGWNKLDASLVWSEPVWSGLFLLLFGRLLSWFGMYSKEQTMGYRWKFLIHELQLSRPGGRYHYSHRGTGSLWMMRGWIFLNFLTKFFRKEVAKKKKKADMNHDYSGKTFMRPT